MSEERCEACVKSAHPDSHTDLDWQNDVAAHHVLLAEERRKREAAEKKLAEAVADFRERMSGRSRQYIVDVLIPQFLATLSKKEADSDLTLRERVNTLLAKAKAWGESEWDDLNYTRLREMLEGKP